jgi:transposase-like protein
MTGKQGSSAESIVREIKRQTRRKFTAEEKIRIVLEGLRGEAGERFAVEAGKKFQLKVAADAAYLCLYK